MKRLRILMMVCLLSLLPVPVKAQSVTPVAPNIFLRGIPVAEGVRYAATIIKPDDNAQMRNLSIEITLPADAVLSEMIIPRQVEFDVIRRNRQGQLTLIWQISRVEADQPVSAVAFTVAQPLVNELEFFASWLQEDGTPVVENFYEVPPLSDPTQAIPQEAATQVLPADFNPPPEFGSIWWCSLFEIAGLPSGTSASVSAPLRRPIAPFTPLQLFQQQPDGTWIALDEQGIVTADGQYVMYTHPGGIVAAGGSDELQPEVVTIDAGQAGDLSPAGEVVIAVPTQPAITEEPAETVPLEEVPTTPAPDEAPAEVAPTAEPLPTAAPTEVPTLVPAEIADGTSNTILLGEVTLTPTPLATGIADGTSNTIQLGEVTLTPTPPAAVPVVTPVKPLPFGRGGPRVEVVIKEGSVLQCQVGRVNCLPLSRRLGSRAR